MPTTNLPEISVTPPEPSSAPPAGGGAVAAAAAQARSDDGLTNEKLQALASYQLGLKIYFCVLDGEIKNAKLLLAPNAHNDLLNFLQKNGGVDIAALSNAFSDQFIHSLVAFLLKGFSEQEWETLGVLNQPLSLGKLLPVLLTTSTCNLPVLIETGISTGTSFVSISLGELEFA